MTLLASTRRSGFTLLELLLASAIGVLLMGGLYMSMDMVLRQTDQGREEVEKNDTARAVVNRLMIDLAGTQGPLPPRSGGIADPAAAAAAGTTTTAPATGTTTTPPATGTTTPDPATGATPDTGTTPDPSESPLSTGMDLPFGCGVVGNEKTLTVFVSRVPKGLSEPGTDPTALLPTDLRRVTYYMGSNGGLCRQENPWVTADGVWNSAEPDRTNELADTVAEEITDVSFEYFDGASWVTTWDGTQLNIDEKSLLGPPRAIRLTLIIEKSNSRGEIVTQKVRHVLPIRSANGLIPVLPPADGGTSTGGQ